MHCLVDLHSHLNSLALLICYILIPGFSYSGTSYRPLASPVYQLSTLLLLYYGRYSGLGLRCGRSPCVLACVLGAFLLDVLKDRLGDQRGGSEWEPIKILLEGD
jgi:hypothetical protein